MLSKTIGTSTVLTLTASPQTVTPTNFDGSTPKVVRIATGSNPAFINFNNAASATSGILVPANTAEHFKLENTTSLVSTGTAYTNPSYIATYVVNTATVSVLQAAVGGLISITPVA